MISTLSESCAAEPLDTTFVSKVLSCYFEHTTYLKEVSLLCERNGGHHMHAEKGALSAVGRFEIRDSCYIQNTGHFNAVEFNICFNQLAYVTYAHCFCTDFFDHTMPEWGSRLKLFTADTFAVHQLSSMLIVKLSSTFKNAISSRFYGKLEIGKMRSRRGAFFAKNHIIFCDDEGGYSEGDVTLAFVPQR